MNIKLAKVSKTLTSLLIIDQFSK